MDLLRFVRRSRPSVHTATHELAQNDPGYDAQADLALGDPQVEHGAPDAFIPFGGMLSPDASGAGYDAERDTGINP